MKVISVNKVTEPGPYTKALELLSLAYEEFSRAAFAEFGNEYVNMNNNTLKVMKTKATIIDAKTFVQSFRLDHLINEVKNETRRQTGNHLTIVKQ